ncbi:hypothetical protein BKA70DRAFT_383993 [Coprinopsis sp. MPI-PUGE-AT-0042]|nr:hypothetical protein BKA70DRAFT_383993 [Coprinopsis sp. MPI-PUGE-AT-0042]
MSASESTSPLNTKPRPEIGTDEALIGRLRKHPAHFWEVVRFKARFISDSNFFAAEHGIPADCDVENGGADKIIQLEVGLDEFESFLKVFDPGYPSHHRYHDDISLDEWVSVLKLSSKWLFNNLRNEAIAKISVFPITPIQRILLARQYSISSWLIEAYIDIIAGMCNSLGYPRLLPQEEAKLLGLDVALELSNIALRRFYNASESNSPVKASILGSERLSKELEEVVAAAGRYGMINDQRHVRHAEADANFDHEGYADKAEIDETLLREGCATVESLSTAENTDGSENESQHSQDEDPTTPIIAHPLPAPTETWDLPSARTGSEASPGRFEAQGEQEPVDWNAESRRMSYGEADSMARRMFDEERPPPTHEQEDLILSSSGDSQTSACEVQPKVNMGGTLPPTNETQIEQARSALPRPGTGRTRWTQLPDDTWVRQDKAEPNVSACEVQPNTELNRGPSTRRTKWTQLPDGTWVRQDKADRNAPACEVQPDAELNHAPEPRNGERLERDRRDVPRVYMNQTSWERRDDGVWVPTEVPSMTNVFEPALSYGASMLAGWASSKVAGWMGSN